MNAQKYSHKEWCMKETNMFRKALIAILMFHSCLFLLPEKIGTIAGVSIPPQGLAVDTTGKTVYVYDQNGINNYSLPGLEHLNRFGGRGEGPGEWRFIFNQGLSIHADGLHVNALGKILKYSKKGKLEKEIPHPPRTYECQEIQGRYIGYVNEQQGKSSVSKVFNLYDKDMKLVKQVYRQATPAHQNRFNSRNPQKVTYRYPPVIFCSHTVYKDKIYIMDTSEDFFIVVFDADGNKLKEIRKECLKRKITQAEKDDYLNRLKTNKRIRQYVHLIDVKFQEYHSALTRFQVIENKIYAITGNEKNKSAVMFLLNLEGETLRKVKVPARSQYFFHFISGDTFFYLTDNNGDTDLELHSIKI
jgi:hypothetical protein